MNIPGMAVSHQIIRRACRDNWGESGAFVEAVARLREMYDQLAANGLTPDTEIHLALIVQQDRHRAAALAAGAPATETVTVTKYRRHADGLVFCSTEAMNEEHYDVLARQFVELTDGVRQRLSEVDSLLRSRDDVVSALSRKDEAIKAALEAYRDRDLSPGESAAKMSDILEAAIS